MRGRIIAGAFVVALLASGATACGDSSDESSSTTTAPGGVVVDDPWCRTSPMAVTSGACYMTLDNESGQATALVSAAVPSTVAARVELHETTTGDATSDTAMTSDTTADAMSDGTDMGSGTDSEMMGMRPVSQIELPEGQSVELVPGGYHVMLLELVEPLQTGQTVQLTLTFADGTTQTVDATVREQ